MWRFQARGDPSSGLKINKKINILWTRGQNTDQKDLLNIQMKEILRRVKEKAQETSFIRHNHKYRKLNAHRNIIFNKSFQFRNLSLLKNIYRFLSRNTQIWSMPMASYKFNCGIYYLLLSEVAVTTVGRKAKKSRVSPEAESHLKQCIKKVGILCR